MTMTPYHFTEFSPAGRFGAVHVLTAESLACAPANTIPGAWSNVTHYFDLVTHTPVAMAPRPGPHHAFDWATKQWADPRTLAALRTAKWEAVKVWREIAFNQPLVTPFGAFDADAEGQKNIERAVLLANNLAALGYAVAIDFTLHDNSIQVMDASAMVQVGLILGGRVQLIRAQATALRHQIESATAAQLSEVAWPAN